MKILSIQPKDVYATIEFGMYEIKYLIDFLNNCSMDYDGKANPELKASATWVENVFFKILEDVNNSVKAKQ